MFWFAGLVGTHLHVYASPDKRFFTGMGIESKSIRRLLASSSLQGAGSGQGPVEEPPSYSGSFNPFPALVIGVTGAAMAAHFQPYVFGVRLYFLKEILY